MRVEQYEQLNVGGKRVIEIYDKSDNILIKQATKRGYIECENGGVADLSYPSSKTRRGRVQECGTICPTITATETGVRKIDKITNKENHGTVNAVVDKTQYRIRKLTPKECWRLMGFSDDAFEKAAYRKENYEIKDLFLNGVFGLRNAKLMDVIEKPLQNDTGVYALNITSVLQDMGITSIEWMKFLEKQKNERNKNVNVVIEKLEGTGHLDSAINIIKCLNFTEILYGLMEELDQHHMAIIGLAEQGKANTVKYMKISSEENLTPMKLFIILIVLEQIIESKIYTSTLQKVNIQGRIANLEDCKNNMVKMQISDLKMEAIYTRTSATQLYKQAGNSIVTSVLYHIYKELYSAMPYLFDDLKVGSYFSGIGAFETALDMLYENENANNFYIPEINFQDSQT